MADQPNATRPRVGWSVQTGEPICYACYAIGHLSTQCTLPVTKLAQIVVNYTALTPDHKARVPDKNYPAALGFLKGTEENELLQEVAAAQHPDSKK